MYDKYDVLFCSIIDVTSTLHLKNTPVKISSIGVILINLLLILKQCNKRLELYSYKKKRPTRRNIFQPSNQS